MEPVGEMQVSDDDHQGKTVVVLQPSYLPWLGFFDQMRRSDVFVYYDDVQFDKHGWRNRNRIKSPTGPVWLTVPIRLHGLGGPKILDTTIDNSTPWARKHVGTMRQFYGRAPHVNRYLPELEEMLHRQWSYLIDLDLAVTDLLRRWLGITTLITRASTIDVTGSKTERLAKLCCHFGSSRYLSGDSAKNYLDTELFAQHEISVEWQDYHHPVYPQLHGVFVSHLSVLDLLFNCGDESGTILQQGSRM